MKKDFYGKEAYLRDNVLRIIENLYKNYGYDSLYTPLLEDNTDDKNQKSVFELTDNFGNKYKLKYDSTLSLVRFISSHEDIKFPYKRYQLQKSFRNIGNDSLKEFYQCDADIIGSKSITSDAEIIEISSLGLYEIGIKDYTIRLNHSKIIEECCKNSKLNEKLSELIKKYPDNTLIFSEVKNKFYDNENLILGITQIESIYNILPNNIRKKCKFDLNTTVNSDYYTGIVFDGCVDDTVLLHGGRYDNLIKNSSNCLLPSVGMAYTLEKIIDVLNRHNIKKSSSNKIIFYLKNEKYDISQEFIKNLREKYSVLTVNSEDLNINEFVDFCKDQHARLIGVVENDNLELYKVEDFEEKNVKKKIYKLKEN